jgi:hypothetical protein
VQSVSSPVVAIALQPLCSEAGRELQQAVKPAQPVADELDELATWQSPSPSKSLWASPQLVASPRATTSMHSFFDEASLSCEQQLGRLVQSPVAELELQAARTARMPTTPMPKNRFTMTRTSAAALVRRADGALLSADSTKRLSPD